MNVKHLWKITAAIVLPAFELAGAHDIDVHRNMTLAVEGSAKEYSVGYKAFLELAKSPDGLELFTSDGVSRNALGWLVDGSEFEDNVGKDHGGKRPYNHFYDPLSTLYGPVRGQGLSNWPFVNSPFPSTGPYGRDSFFWATTRNCPGVNFRGSSLEETWNMGTYNSWSFQNARDYQLLGLTASSPTVRNESLAKLFRALGQVVHLLEDTTQPQHVRNEQHLENLPNFRSSLEAYGHANVGSLSYTHGILDWRRARFSQVKEFWDRTKYTGTSAQPLIDSEDPKKPEEKLGLAEFVNGNFLGDRHTYYETTKPPFNYPYPSLYLGTDWPNLLREPQKHGKVIMVGNEFYRTLVVEKTDEQGRRVGSHASIGYFLSQNPSLANNLNARIEHPSVLKAYLDVLIPEAIKYSAGLLDYFFRGALQVSVGKSGASYQMHIINRSGQTIKGGSFALFKDEANGDRSAITLTSSWSDNSTLAADQAIDVTFSGSFSANTKCVLVYKGTIGWESGQPLDKVDDGIAVAAATFTIEPEAACEGVSRLQAPREALPNTPGTQARTSENAIMPKPGGTLVVHLDSSVLVNVTVGDLVVLNGAGEFEVTLYDDQTEPLNPKIALESKDGVNRAPTGTDIPAGSDIMSRPALIPWKAVYVPSVNKIFVTAEYDMVLVIDPQTLLVEKYFHINNLVQLSAPSAFEYIYGMVYAPDVDRLYVPSALGKIYVINPSTCVVDTAINWTSSDDLVALDGFYDEFNHRVGFAYAKDFSFNSGLILVRTTDNSVVADLSDRGWQAAVYCPLDDSYYSDDTSFNTVRVSSASTFAATQNIPTPSSSSILHMCYCPETGEIYCGIYGQPGAFYIDPVGSSVDTLVSAVVVPPVGDTASFSVSTTTGMAAGKPVRVNGLLWTIQSVTDSTHFVARNEKSPQGTTLEAGTTVSWGGPIAMPLPNSVGSGCYVIWSEPIKRMIFIGDNSVVALNPSTKQISCTLQNPTGEALQIGSSDALGRVFIPDVRRSGTSDPDSFGVSIMH